MNQSCRNRSSLFLPACIAGGAILFLYFFLLFSKILMVFCLSGDYFNSLSVSEILRSFLTSFTYDWYVVAHFLLPLLILLFMPIKGKWFLKILTVCIVLLLCVLCFFTAGDIIFFNLFFSHLGTEAITALAHIPFILSMAFGTYWYVTFPLIGGTVYILYLLCRFVDKYYVAPEWDWVFLAFRTSLVVLLVLCLLFGIKGKLSFHGRSLSSMTAQKLANPKMTDIALNGVFSTFDSLRHYQSRDLFFTKEDALAFMTQRVHSPKEQVLNKEYPLWRKLQKSTEKKPLNAVIILLESWDKKYLDVQPDITPFFHNLKKDSLYYENFYSTGSRSLLGVTSSFFSIPYVWGLPYLNTGLEKYNFPRWAALLQNRDWQTLFLQSDYRLSEKAANWTQYLGFEYFYGKEDIPIEADYPSFNKGFDMEAGQFFAQRLKKMKKPFFAVFYTSSTHSPYTAVLSRKHMPFAEPKDQYEQYYNRLSYADAALKEFFEQAKKEAWFKDTVFFIFPDHRAIFGATPLTEKETPFDSFLLVYAPGLISAGKPKEVVATPEDILPSVLDVMGADIPYASTGSSIFDKNRHNEKFVYGENGDMYAFGRNGFARFSLHELKNTPLSQWPQQAQNAVLFNEGVYHTISQNMITPKN